MKLDQILKDANIKDGTIIDASGWRCSGMYLYENGNVYKFQGVEGYETTPRLFQHLIKSGTFTVPEEIKEENCSVEIPKTFQICKVTSDGTIEIGNDGNFVCVSTIVFLASILIVDPGMHQHITLLAVVDIFTKINSTM